MLSMMKERLAKSNRPTPTERPPEISADMVTGDEHGLNVVTPGTEKALSALVVLGQVSLARSDPLCWTVEKIDGFDSVYADDGIMN